MNRTGKFGVIIPANAEGKADDILMRTVWEKIDDGRQYIVTAGTYAHNDASYECGPSSGTKRKARVVVWLRNWRDAEIGEWCEQPDSRELANFERGEVDNPHDHLFPTTATYTLEGKTFKGMGMWTRTA